MLPADQQADLLGFKDGDDKRLLANFDFIGVNYYSRTMVHDAPEGNPIPGLRTRDIWAAGTNAKTDSGWDIYPQGFYDITQKISQHVGRHKPIEITENGMAYNLGPGPDGKIHDQARIDFLRSHLKELSRAIDDGVPIRSYHCWTLMDNFEWGQGFTKRFGLAYVDFAQGQKRILKDSGYWYAKVAKDNQVL